MRFGRKKGGDEPADEEPPRAVTEEAKASRRRLLARIEELGGDRAVPVVSLELFFENNDDGARLRAGGTGRAAAAVRRG